jgi:hypothetical protein
LLSNLSRSLPGAAAHAEAMMTVKIVIERTSPGVVRVTLNADIEISVNADLAGVRTGAEKLADPGISSSATPHTPAKHSRVPAYLETPAARICKPRHLRVRIR